jgi:general stress protein 26
MGDFQNLSGREAIKKIKSLSEDAKTCMFNTNLTEIPFHTRPMSLQEVDENGDIWFFSGADSDKNQALSSDERVQLTFMNNGSYEYLSLFGKAVVVKDRQRAEELWDSFVKTWFPGGIDDPNLSLIKFTPDTGHYWDTKNNKIVAIAKIAIGSITGQTMDDSVEGNVNP